MQASRKTFELSLASAYFVHFLSTSPAISRNRFCQVPGPTVPPSPAVVVKSPAPFQARLGMQRSDRSDWMNWSMVNHPMMKMEENSPQNVPYMDSDTQVFPTRARISQTKPEKLIDPQVGPATSFIA